MITFQRIGNGGSPNITTMPDFKDALIQALSQNGMRVYDGDPSQNGCPFNFSQFTYNPGSSTSYYTMFLVVMNQNVDNMCLILTSGAILLSTGFTSTTSNAYIAVAYVDDQGKISLSSASNSFSLMYSLDSYIITTNSAVSIVWGTSSTTHGICIGSNVWAYLNSASDIGFFTSGFVALNIPNIVADDPHTIVINKPIGEYGVAAIAFPSADTASQAVNYNRQYLIQNTTYYCVSNPGAAVKYCIY